ncbi:hypothetical protein TNCV_918811 [Trichonephila clavipes]|nr:hypothetical protein TNCV_918811 [Trichonephila clavipes]
MLNLDSLLKTTCFHFVAGIFRCSQHHFKRRQRWVGVIGSTGSWYRDTRCPSGRRFTTVQEVTGHLSEGAALCLNNCDKSIRNFITNLLSRLF